MAYYIYIVLYFAFCSFTVSVDGYLYHHHTACCVCSVYIQTLYAMCDLLLSRSTHTHEWPLFDADNSHSYSTSLSMKASYIHIHTHTHIYNIQSHGTENSKSQCGKSNNRNNIDTEKERARAASSMAATAQYHNTLETNELIIQYLIISPYLLNFFLFIIFKNHLRGCVRACARVCMCV